MSYSAVVSERALKELTTKIIFIHSIFHTRRNPKGKYKV